MCEAWHRRGRIPDSAMPAIRAATCDLDRMRAIEREVDHDVIAFLRATGETIGPDARFIHVGLTSSDVVDTALGYASGYRRGQDAWPNSIGSPRSSVARLSAIATR